MEITWKEPPARRRGRPKGNNRWAGVLPALQARPGEWALIASDLGQGGPVSDAKKALVGCEVVSRTIAKGRVDIYARFVGEVTR